MLEASGHGPGLSGFSIIGSSALSLLAHWGTS